GRIAQLREARRVAASFNSRARFMTQFVNRSFDRASPVARSRRRALGTISPQLLAAPDVGPRLGRRKRYHSFRATHAGELGPLGD
ncbi:MAG: hypothetical protein ABI779_05725, partial [Acidobacteriota bacterium]